MLGWFIIIMFAIASGVLPIISPGYRRLYATKKPNGLIVQGLPTQLLGLAAIWLGAFMIYAASHFIEGQGSIKYMIPNWIMLSLGFSMSILFLLWGVGILRYWGKYDDWGFCWYSLLGKKKYAWSEMTGWKEEEDGAISINFDKKKFRFHSGWIGQKELLRWLENKDRYLAARCPNGVLIGAIFFRKV